MFNLLTLPCLAYEVHIPSPDRVIIIVYKINPLSAGVSSQTHLAVGRGYYRPAKSRTSIRSEVGEATIEGSQWVLFRELEKKYLKYHKSGQGQVKGQNCYFSPYRIPGRD